MKIYIFQSGRSLRCLMLPSSIAIMSQNGAYLVSANSSSIKSLSLTLLPKKQDWSSTFAKKISFRFLNNIPFYIKNISKRSSNLKLKDSQHKLSSCIAGNAMASISIRIAPILCSGLILCVWRGNKLWDLWLTTTTAVENDTTDIVPSAKRSRIWVCNQSNLTSTNTGPPFTQNTIVLIFISVDDE